MQIDTRFTYEKVKHNQENDVHLVVTLRAPKTDWQEKRPSVCIVPVIDVSSSMAGEKLDYAKKSVMKLIDHLKPGDFCGVVTFDDQVKTISAPMEMTQEKKEQLKALVGALGTGGCTNFAGGMCEGLELLNKKDIPSNLLLRVIMFTDGQANRGVATGRDLIPLLEKVLGRATLSAFGYGADADQELLADLAKKGKGNYAFIKNPDDALSAFAKELGGLLSTYAQDLVISVDPHNGHRIQEVLSDVDVEQDGNAVKIKIPDIFAEEERHLVLAMKLSEQSQALPRAMNVADVKVVYGLLDEKGKKGKKTEECKAKIQFVKPGEEQTTPTKEVDKIVSLAQLVKAQVEAETQAKAGNYTAAQNVMAVLADDFAQRGLAAEGAAASYTGQSMGSAQLYASNQGYLRSMRHASRGTGASAMAPEAAIHLSAMGASMSTSAQVQMQAQFVGGGGTITGQSLPQPAPVVKPASTPAPKPAGLSKRRSERW